MWQYIHTFYSPLRKCSKLTLINQRFKKHHCKVFTNLTSKRSLDEIHCKISEITLNNWHGPWITFNSHFIVSTAVYPAGIKEYWNIQNLTASTEVQNLTSLYWAKQVVMSLKWIRVFSDRQPKVQSIIFQSCISTPETCKSLSHLTHWYPSILACYIIWTQIFYIQMITMNCWAS